MTCELATLINSITQSIRDLQERTDILLQSITLPTNLVNLCGDGGGSGLLAQLYYAVLTFVLDAGSQVTETVARPDEPPQCHTGVYMEAVKAWVDGIVLAGSALCSLDVRRRLTDPPGIFDETYSSGNGGYRLRIAWATFFTPDRLVISDQDDTILLDTGCFSTGGSYVTLTVDLPLGTTSVRFVVYPNCNPPPGADAPASWNFVTTCSSI